MTVPSSKDIAPFLRDLLTKYPQGVAPNDIYLELAESMGLHEDALSETVTAGRRRWHIQVQNARKLLVAAGEVARKPFGRWKLTAKGRATAALHGNFQIATDERSLTGLLARDGRATEKLQLILARIGQGIFRERVVARDGACQLCGMDQRDLLLASHIKPWSVADDRERLDPENGLLLCPGADRLFDRGYTTSRSSTTAVCSGPRASLSGRAPSSASRSQPEACASQRVEPTCGTTETTSSAGDAGRRSRRSIEPGTAARPATRATSMSCSSWPTPRAPRRRAGGRLSRRVDPRRDRDGKVSNSAQLAVATDSQPPRAHDDTPPTRRGGSA